MISRVVLVIVAVFLCRTCAGAATDTVTIGSKTFTESVILGELATRLTQDAGAKAVHRRQLGGTRILFNALQAGELDIYPEYSGTITREILASLDMRDDA